MTFDRTQLVARGEGKRLNRIVVLAANPQPRPARCQDVNARALSNQLRDVGRCAENLFEVVEDQQHTAVAEAIDDRGERGLARLCANRESARDRRRNKARISNCGEVDEEDAVLVSVLDPVSELEHEARLSASTWPRERDQLPDGGKVLQLAELLCAPNQTGRAAWEVGDGWSSRKVEPLLSKLEKTDWLVEVLDPVLAKIPDLGANEVPCRLRQEDLTGLCRGADAGGQVDV